MNKIELFFLIYMVSLIILFIVLFSVKLSNSDMSEEITKSDNEHHKFIYNDCIGKVSINKQGEILESYGEHDIVFDKEKTLIRIEICGLHE